MHLTNIPLSLWLFVVNKNHGAADSELYINKCKAEKPRNLYLVTALTAQVAPAFARAWGLQLGTHISFQK